MSQILALGKNQYITIDRSWADGGKPVRHGLVGGQLVMLTEGTKPKPSILMVGKEFFYTNGLPVTKIEDVSYLEEPYRSQAETYIRSGQAKPAPIKATESEAAAPKRGRGRPKTVTPKGPRKIEIKDEASLRSVSGDANLDEYEDEEN